MSISFGGITYLIITLFHQHFTYNIKSTMNSVHDENIGNACTMKCIESTHWI